MKTISLELDERIYPQVVNFLRLLPEELCRVMDADDTVLTTEECSDIEAIRTDLDSGSRTVIGESVEPVPETPWKYREPPPELAGEMRFSCDEKTLHQPVVQENEWHALK